ncbi:MAG: DUF6090 family protein [Bacteroidota bacterium]
MIKFFRHIRQRLLSEGKFSEYLMYAAGEIVLVVVGILIALQINTWNEHQQKKGQLWQHRENLIAELQIDLKTLDSLNHLRDKHEANIKKYIDYYNQENLNINLLRQKKDSVIYSINSFNKSSFTLDELGTTGDISLFSELEKKAIAKLKNTHEIYQYYERTTFDGVVHIVQEYVTATDNFYENKVSTKQHRSVTDWQLNINSEQYRLFHNQLYNVLVLYGFQKNTVYPAIRRDTEALLDILEQKLKGGND